MRETFLISIYTNICKSSALFKRVLIFNSSPFSFMSIRNNDTIESSDISIGYNERRLIKLHSRHFVVSRKASFRSRAPLVIIIVVASGRRFFFPRIDQSNRNRFHRPRHPWKSAGNARSVADRSVTVSGSIKMENNPRGMRGNVGRWGRRARWGVGAPSRCVHAHARAPIGHPYRGCTNTPSPQWPTLRARGSSVALRLSALARGIAVNRVYAYHLFAIHRVRFGRTRERPSTTCWTFWWTARTG